MSLADEILSTVGLPTLQSAHGALGTLRGRHRDDHPVTAVAVGSTRGTRLDEADAARAERSQNVELRIVETPALMSDGTHYDGVTAASLEDWNQWVDAAGVVWTITQPAEETTPTHVVYRVVRRAAQDRSRPAYRGGRV